LPAEILNERTLNGFLDAITGTPALAGLAVSDPSAWAKLTPAQLRRFDYILAKAPPAATTEALVGETVRLLEQHPIDILSGLMDSPAAQQLNAEQKTRLIAAAVKHGVAFEIGTRHAGLSAEFVAQAKAAGVKFTLGSRQATAADWTDWTQALPLIAETKLTWREMYMPGHAPGRAQK
jgi:hypothetical protein